MLKHLAPCLLLLILFLSACSETVVPPSPTPDPLLTDTTPKPIDLTAEDGIALKATYYPQLSGPAPALLLLHMLNSNKEAWSGFALKAQEAGYVVLALDLRGHGESGGGQDFPAMSLDVDAALAWLTGRSEVDGERIGMAGGSLGANIALRSAANRPEVKSVVLLSPGLTYQGLTTLDALAIYGRRPLMLVAAEQDTYAADSSRELNIQALGQHQLQIYPNADHGTNLLQVQAGLTPMMLAWYQTTLVP
ncbi:MAG: alpha/beta fold hydrolase [Chloroflexota bacterium]